MIKPIDQLINSLIIPEHEWKKNLLSNWTDIIGHLSSQVRLEKIDNDSLILGVNDSSWLQELYLLTPILLETINAKLDKPRIKKLKFKQTPKKKERIRNIHNCSQTPAKKVTLTKKEQAILNNIEDADLRNALKNFLLRCYQERP
ncbi:MAG: DUF721 domain-containing protein [Candidatus Babeliales bacterium]